MRQAQEQIYKTADEHNPRDSTTDKAEGPTVKEELGHDKPSQALGLEHTKRKIKQTFWLVGADTLV